MTETTQPNTRYQAYLLRIWRADERTPWRASLEDPHSGSTQRFSSMKDLFAYLNSHTSEEVGLEPGSENA